MAKGASSSKASALFVSAPVLGILFLFVPWEVDPRAENPEKRLERLTSPRQAYLVDFLSHDIFHGGYASSSNDKWDGLFSWQRKELRELRVQKDLDQNGGVNFLRKAIMEDNFDGLIALLRRGADPNRADAEGRRPLHLMVERCSAEQSRRNYESCHGALCPDVRKEAVKNRVVDIGRSRFFEALISNGATIDFTIPVNDITPTPSLTLLEYARLRCPAEVVNVISKGKRERPNQ